MFQINSLYHRKALRTVIMKNESMRIQVGQKVYIRKGRKNVSDATEIPPSSRLHS